MADEEDTGCPSRSSNRDVLQDVFIPSYSKTYEDYCEKDLE